MSDSANANNKRVPDEHQVPLWLAVLICALAVCVVVAGVAAYRLASSATVPSLKGLAALRVESAKSQVAATKGSLPSHLQLAYAYQRAGDYPAATKEYKTVLRADPKNTAAEYNLGVIDELKGDTKSAAAHYERVLALVPGHELAAKRLSVIQYANEDWDGMLATLERAVQKNGSLSDLRYFLGVAYEKTGQRNKAVAEYRAALRFYPGMREAKEALARLE
jgi:tetratricopeptide (TPR) repeat protein